MSTSSAKVRARDIIERTFWTFVTAALSSLVGVTLLGVDVWKGAAMAGLAAVINFLLVVARWRLSVLPDPGTGMPGLPTGAHLVKRPGG